MANRAQSPDTLTQALTAAQLDKLKLEIEKLTIEAAELKKKQPEKKRFNLLAYTPLISVLIAVAGFLFGVLQYHNQQEKARLNERTDQRLKVQAQIRDNLTRILQFPKEKNLTLSQISFLLDDLDRLLRISIGGVEVTSEHLQAEQRKITLNLNHLILDDCNFDEPTHADLGRIVLDGWDDYKAYLKTDEDSLEDLLLKYTDALTTLHALAPSYISQIRYSEDTTSFDEPSGASDKDKSHLRHFEDLVRGFSDYLELSENQEFRVEAVKDFQSAICNEVLTKQELGISFDPKSDPVIFVDCLTNGRKK
jgi:hypothetical protein